MPGSTSTLLLAPQSAFDPIKIILDALSGIVYEDDCQIAELHLVRITMQRNSESRVVVTATHDI